jgi:hypothetical protein
VLPNECTRLRSVGRRRQVRLDLYVQLVSAGARQVVGEPGEVGAWLRRNGAADRKAPPQLRLECPREERLDKPGLANLAVC